MYFVQFYPFEGIGEAKNPCANEGDEYVGDNLYGVSRGADVGWTGHSLSSGSKVAFNLISHL